MGLSQADDSWYLSDGVAFSPRHFAGLHYWSPLYLLWLRLLGFVWPDPVWRYFASWGLLTLLLALIPVVMKIRYAWIYTLLVVMLAAPDVSPYIGMFAGVIVVLVFCMVLRSRLSCSEALGVSCLTCAVLGYCRPEFDYGVFLGAMATLVSVGLEWRALSLPGVSRSVMKSLAASVVLLAAMTAVVMHRALGQRSGAAFAQHFNRRAALRRILSYSTPTWLSDYAERTFGIDLQHNALNGTATVGEFFRANPGLFLTHVLDNIAEPLTVVVLLAVGASLAWPWLRPGKEAFRPASLFLGVMAAPVLLEMALIYPREHYAVILLPSVALFALQALDREQWLQPPMPWVLVAGMALMFYTGVVLPRLHWDPPTQDQIGLSQVECMRRIDRSAPLSYKYAFDSVGIRDVYLTAPRIQIDQWKLGQLPDFERWALATHPAWVTVSEGLAEHYGTTPAHLESFLGGDLGYLAHPCSERAHLTIYAPRM